MIKKKKGCNIDPFHFLHKKILGALPHPNPSKIQEDSSQLLQVFILLQQVSLLLQLLTRLLLRFFFFLLLFNLFLLPLVAFYQNSFRKLSPMAAVCVSVSQCEPRTIKLSSYWTVPSTQRCH